MGTKITQMHQCWPFSHHSKDAPSVLNPTAGSITTQWNVTFNDHFATVNGNPEDLPDFNAEEWSQMFGASACHFPADNSNVADNKAEPPPTRNTTFPLHILGTLIK